MTNKLGELATCVRILELEERKLELEKNITQLEAEHPIDVGCVGCAGPCKVVDVSVNLQKELDEAHGILASKDRVIVNLHKTINDFKTIETKETDRLREELDVTRNKYFTGQRYIAKQSAKIRSRDAELHDLKMYQPDNFWAVVTEKDSVIRRQGEIIKELKDRNIEDLKELYELDKVEFSSMKSDYEIILQNRRNRGDKLEDNIEGLEAELSTCKRDSVVLKKVVEIVREWDHLSAMVCTYDMRHLRDVVKDYLGAQEVPPETPIEDQKRTIDNFINYIEGLEAEISGLESELSTCKRDSDVLLNVVDVANRWSDERIASRPAMNQIAYLVKDYHDAHEVPPETPIDESQNIAVVFTYGEIL